ncbi:MAG: hypothetical protein RPU34_10425 [Candidatus Sedimenticola sp. (ex Thyasira tokunagai)]
MRFDAHPPLSPLWDIATKEIVFFIEVIGTGGLGGNGKQRGFPIYLKPQKNAAFTHQSRFIRQKLNKNNKTLQNQNVNRKHSN